MGSILLIFYRGSDVKIDKIKVLINKHYYLYNGL